LRTVFANASTLRPFLGQAFPRQTCLMTSGVTLRRSCA
jgi:hypothetical protein